MSVRPSCTSVFVFVYVCLSVCRLVGLSFAHALCHPRKWNVFLSFAMELLLLLLLELVTCASIKSQVTIANVYMCLLFTHVDIAVVF